MIWAATVDLITLVSAAAIAAVLIVLLHPLLQRYALARPNARSSHRSPTPQGGGIAIIASIAAVLAIVGFAEPALLPEPFRLTVVLAAAASLAVVGGIDDIRPIEAWSRLILQAAAVAIVIAVLPANLRIVPLLPWWIERTLLAIGMLWLVNLVNFMDGIDWITVAEVVPITAALAVFGWWGELPSDATLLSLALCGASLGFAPFNRPVAKLFLGDVGTLPVGLLLGWLLIMLAKQHLFAALLLPLYYLADATITLLRRLLRGERIMQAHRRHFYQQAVDGGASVYQVVTRIFAINVALALLAAMTLNTSPALQALALLCGAVLVGVLLTALARPKPQ